MSSVLALRAPHRSLSTRWRVPMMEGSWTATASPIQRMPKVVVPEQEEVQHIALRRRSAFQPDVRQFEERLAEVLQNLSQAIELASMREYPETEVEQDVWVQLPPKREFTVKMRLVFEGKAKPSVFADWVQDDE